ncbi:trypsin-like serine protease [Marinicella meishanensis]|uniref:trypsin-like serine protease n=1 Tax=Marinicella meishanensis TaxID=2873263 RepID=UPI001CBC9A2E|nr:trypsin-like serine protease [Marinicella sp. NBU2979]
MKILPLMMFLVWQQAVANDVPFSAADIRYLTPELQADTHSDDESNHPEQRRVMLFDLNHQTDQSWPASPPPKRLPDDAPITGLQVTDSMIDHLSTHPAMGQPTPPTQALGTTAYPLSSIVKIIARYRVNGDDFWGGCSGFMASNFHVVTAGHCIYSFDPNGDGDTSDRRSADEVWVYPGQTDWVLPEQCGISLCADWPFGLAKAVALRSYSGWTEDQNYDHDWGVITLDRIVGHYTGAMGRSSDVPDSVNYSGYPSEEPYVPAGVNVQYKGYDEDNVTNHNGHIMALFAAIYGGHSGGPVWRYANNQRHVVGIISNGNRVDNTHVVRLTAGKRSDLNSWIAQDVTLYPPQAAGELIEYLYDRDPHKSIDKNTVGKNEVLTFDYSIQNMGFADITRNIQIAFYATDDPITWDAITDQDNPLNPFEFLLDEVVTGVDFTPGYIRHLSTSIFIPDTLPAGDYNLAITYQTIGEYPADLNCYGSECSNKILLPGFPLTVAECTSDIWEDDNTLATATVTPDGNSRLRSICTVGDVDHVGVDLSDDEYMTVTFETTGPTGDTLLTLLDNEGAVIAVDDDNGVNQFSKITRQCLPAGTYFLRVEEHGNDAIIDRYDLNGTVGECENLIFKNTFEAPIVNP